MFIKLVVLVCCLAYMVEAQTYYFPSNGVRAIAILRGTYNGLTIRGTVQFKQSFYNSPVYVYVNITGLPTGSSARHGIHVHQNGILTTSDSVTDICNSALAHFNPYNQTHGDISSAVRHVGDYGNLVRDTSGRISATFKDTVSQLYGPLSVIGRTVVLHELQDDLGLGGVAASLTTGNAGSRIACGVIGINES